MNARPDLFPTERRLTWREARERKDRAEFLAMLTTDAQAGKPGARELLDVVNEQAKLNARFDEAVYSWLFGPDWRPTT